MSDTPEKRPLIAVDVDGVLSAIAWNGRKIGWTCPEGYQKHKVLLDGRRYTIALNRAHGSALLRLAAATGAELAWGTMWGEHANTVIAPRLGLPRLPVIPAAESYYGPERCKAAAILEYAAGRPVVWFDDDPEEQEQFSRRVLLREAPGYCIPVNALTGLTAADIHEAHVWLEGHAEVRNVRRG
jgi:hypothetical protein